MENSYDKAKKLLTHPNFNKLTTEQIQKIYETILMSGISKDQINEILTSKNLDRTRLYHVTSLEGLYNILNSGYIRPRNFTNAKVGYSPASHKGSGDWVYLGFNSSLPPPGRLSIQLVFSSKLLKDRQDYYLNREWNYGKSESSLPPSKLNEFLQNLGPVAEVIFENEIPIDSYLIEINIIQFPAKLIQMMPIDARPAEIDYGQIPLKYQNLIKIIEKV
jgi:hypothetical protein